jgi:hypothetical protein
MNHNYAQPRPEDFASSGLGMARVHSSVSCILTRFRLTSPLFLPFFYLAFRRVQRDCSHLAGLLHSVLLVENFRTCYTLSFWKDDRSILEFGNIRSHVAVATRALRLTYRKDLERAEIWSAQFRLWAISSDNLTWEGFDLETCLTRQSENSRNWPRQEGNHAS